jgi:ketosteroid isomerase-like protein
MRIVAGGPRSILVGLVILFASTACASPDPEAGTGSATQPSPEMTAEVAAFLDAYLSAIDARDADFIRGAYVDDGRFVWIEDGEVRYRGAEEILASLNAFPAGGAIRTELSGLEVVALGGNGAHAWATFTTTVGSGPGSFSFGGAISFVLERAGDSWRLAGGHTSSPGPEAR